MLFTFIPVYKGLDEYDRPERYPVRGRFLRRQRHPERLRLPEEAAISNGPARRLRTPLPQVTKGHVTRGRGVVCANY